MRVNFSVTNQLATPSIHAAALANRPPAGQPGRLFVDTDNPSSGIYRDTGTVWENITGGAGAGNLQTVTDAGNTTDNNILLTYPDNTLANALVFYNDALAQEEYLIEKRGTGITTNDSLAIQSRGNISPSTNPVGFLIDGANDVIKTFYTTSYTELGLKLDFANNYAVIGDTANNSVVFDFIQGNLFTSIAAGGSGINVIASTADVELGDFQGNLNATVFDVLDSTSTIKSKYQGNDIGLKLDFANNLYHLGDPDNNVTGTVFSVDPASSLIKAAYGSDNGLKLDFNNGEFYLGTFSGGNNFVWVDNANGVNLGDPLYNGDGTYLRVNDNNRIINSSYQGNDVGIKLDFANYSYYFGDFAASNSGTYFLIDDNNQIIESYCVNVGPGGNGGLQLDFGTNKYSLGDYNNGVSGTSLIVDDANQLIKTENQGADIGLKLDFASDTYALGSNFGTNLFGIDSANNKLIASTNLLVGSSGSVSGQHLKIKVGTTDYVIELRNP